MFEFEKLSVYNKAKTLNAEVLKLMSENRGLVGVTTIQKEFMAGGSREHIRTG